VIANARGNKKVSERSRSKAVLLPGGTSQRKCFHLTTITAGNGGERRKCQNSKGRVEGTGRSQFFAKKKKREPRSVSRREKSGLRRLLG